MFSTKNIQKLCLTLKIAWAAISLFAIVFEQETLDQWKLKTFIEFVRPLQLKD